MSLISNIIELRLGKIEGQLDSLTAINKHRVNQSQVNRLGLIQDEQAESFHGGQDRALLQHDKLHYKTLALRFPHSKHLFVAGGFGENLVVEGMNEHNLCIGDQFRIGSCLLEISQPRSPCFKLNTRFEEPSLARFVQENQQTGWFYRVLEEGAIQVNDEIHLIKRPHPKWTIAKVLHCLYIDTNDQDSCQELAVLAPLADETKEVFIDRLKTKTVEDWSSRLDEEDARLEVEVVAIIDEVLSQVKGDNSAPNKPIKPIKRFYLRPTNEGRLSQAAAGSHIMLELNNGLSRAYSLCSPILNDGTDNNDAINANNLSYEIAVQLSDNAKGGSLFMHQALTLGDKVNIKAPANYFPMSRGQHHIFIAAGIGITPFLAMIKEAISFNETYELHYCVSDTHQYPFKETLVPYAANLALYTSKDRLELKALFKTPASNLHIYTCGSANFVNQVREGVNHWPDENIHFEHFSQDQSNNKAFKVSIKGSTDILDVEPETSLIEVLRQRGHNIASHCETGICGKCQISYEGDVEHRDSVLSHTEKKHRMTPCVSRAKGEHLILSLE